MTSLVDAESVLAIDIGSLNTRALLLDVVDGQYHFIASAAAPTTAGAPFNDVSEGVHLALQRLQEITGRTLEDTDAHLIIPSQSDGSGIDRLALTCSAGPDLNVVTMGLLSDVSLQSAQRLAGSVYGRVVESVGLNDRRKTEGQLDAILHARPDIIIISGGTEKGATRSVNKLVELVAMACRILPRDNRPKVLYCGNSALSKRVKENLERDAAVVVAPNIRPTIDVEDLGPAGTQLSRIVAKIRTQQLGGLNALASLSSAPIQTSAFAMGRMMRLVSGMTDLAKPVLGVDVGSNSTTLAVGEPSGGLMSVSRGLGMGQGLQAALQQVRLEDVMQWLPFEIPAAEVRDYLYQKSLYPASLPLTRETLAIEQAMTRQILRQARSRLLECWPRLQMSFKYIFVGGAPLAQAPALSQSLMMVLDGLMPVGVNMLMLDPHGLSQALGAIAGINSLLPSQVLESGAYVNLGTVICPVSRARPGATILKIKVVQEDGSSVPVEVKQGSLVKLPIRQGQTVELQIDKYHGTVLDPAAPRLEKGVNVVGGMCGVFVDARGRPLYLADDPARRQEQLQRWSTAFD